MKKIIMVMMLMLSLNVLAETTFQDVDNNIRERIKKEYPIDEYGAYMQKIMYDQEINAYIWFTQNLHNEDPKEVQDAFTRTVKNYHPDEYGWYFLKIMFQQELESLNW